MTMQIAKQECDLVRNELKTSLAQKKREYTQNFLNNQDRIDKLEIQIRNTNGHNILSATQQYQIPSTSAIIRDVNSILYRPTSANLLQLQPAQYYTHHHYEQPQQATANLHSSTHPSRWPVQSDPAKRPAMYNSSSNVNKNSWLKIKKKKKKKLKNYYNLKKTEVLKIAHKNNAPLNLAKLNKLLKILNWNAYGQVNKILELKTLIVDKSFDNNEFDKNHFDTINNFIDRGEFSNLYTETE